MPDLVIPLPRMRYDITLPLVDGRIGVAGVAFDLADTMPMVFRDVPALRTGAFGLWDLNLGYWLPAIEAGWELVTLPLFVKRKSALQYVFVRTDAGIARPADLAGKRIGTRQYRTAITLWVRGLLNERYGVDIGRIRWVAQVPEVFASYDRTTEVAYIDPGAALADLLLAGALDGIVTDISDGALLGRLEASPKVRRLFPDYRADDLALWRETGIHAPMHVIVMSAGLDRDHPDLAARLYRAFVDAKALAYKELADDRAGFSVVSLREHFEAQQRAWGDPWPYGIAADRRCIDAFIRHNHEQGAIRAPLAYERIFARGVLDT